VRVRDELISFAGHDLRTPLGGARLSLQLLQRELAQGAEPSALGPRLDLTLHQLDKVGEMTGRLLDISRIAAGRLSVALEQLDLGTVVRDVVGRLFPPAPGTPRIEVAFDGP
jgi:signal transduction histidine kinase